MFIIAMMIIIVMTDFLELLLQLEDQDVWGSNPGHPNWGGESHPCPVLSLSFLCLEGNWADPKADHMEGELWGTEGGLPGDL